jgi:uncharacterized glyoxalase superfamily protein PhnB
MIALPPMPNAKFPAYLMSTLTVNDCKAAVTCYKEAFGATEIFSDREYHAGRSANP